MAGEVRFMLLLGNIVFVYFALRAFIPWFRADFGEFLARAKIAMIFSPFPPLLYYELFMRKTKEREGDGS